ncbi:MAG: YciI family protein [Pseudomonadota bacterium]
MSRIVAYAVSCYDKPGPNAARIRDEKMAEHLAHIEETLDQLWLAGPLFDGEDVVGSLLILKAESEAEALSMAKSDPYGKAGIWERIEVRRFVGAAGDWVGGKTW